MNLYVLSCNDLVLGVYNDAIQATLHVDKFLNDKNNLAKLVEDSKMRGKNRIEFRLTPCLMQSGPPPYFVANPNGDFIMDIDFEGNQIMHNMGPAVDEILGTKKSNLN